MTYFDVAFNHEVISIHFPNQFEMDQSLNGSKLLNKHGTYFRGRWYNPSQGVVGPRLESVAKLAMNTTSKMSDYDQGSLMWS